MKQLPQHPDDDWQPCQPGTIFGLKSDFDCPQLFSRRTALIQLAGICGGGAVVTGAAMFGLIRQNDQQLNILPAEIGCVQVHQYLAAFAADRINDRQLRANISNHLNHCRGCKRAFVEVNASRKDSCSR